LLGLLQTVYTGGRALLMSPFAFPHDPRQWLRAISRGRAVYSSAPNAAYELCVRRIAADEVEGFDLSHWRVALCGAEPIRRATIERFARHFAPAGFRLEAFTPCYGLAEATLSVTMTQPRQPPVIAARDGRQIVGCGRPLPSQQVIIVDTATRARLGDGEVGEIWVAGPNVGSGYWRRPEETETTFRAGLADGTGPWLRTGDLGFLTDGELFVSGRQKDLIIIAGRNHYPEDIEATIEQAHPDLPPASAAAFAVDDDVAESLIVVVELPRPVAASASDAVFAAVRRALAESHDLRPRAIAALRPGALPRTSSGKIQRAACRDAWLGGTLPIMTRDPA
jgi:acyl-CoA synthetase (AMP-forming)/AMP-acid ligase II